ncbi:MAG: site-specific DNA-methyltransferase [Candidatus Marinimicrobia bacterium]|mgnify:CR=1 FL=1|nr:site-specific DNA-methyltransferase [Candidatus Neomarinimicrobiota bacterium]|tara:strand:- start:1482 stop:2768 length:1287 start_codon:yes stop_codon:yes gene_type:complete
MNDTSFGTGSRILHDQEGSINSNKIYNSIYCGDNLTILKHLLDDYSSKVDMIYIDPPYNTGKDFTFRDSFKHDRYKKLPLLKEVGATDPHSLWRQFMTPRLEKSRELLADCGLIFISIDDNELHNLRTIMNEIYGDQNFIATLVRQSGVAPRQDAKHVAIQHDYVVIYAKNANSAVINRKPSALKGFVLEDDHIEVRGCYRLNKLDRGSIRYSDSLDYPITAPDGNEVWPGGDPSDRKWTWRWSQTKVAWGIENDFIVFKKSRDGKPSVYFKEYEKVDNQCRPKVRTNPYSTLIRGCPNEKGNRELKTLFKRRVFDYPKPVDLIKLLLKMGTRKNSLVLDFFAGAGSTGHAVWALNREDGGSRRFILAQLDEPVLDEDVEKDFPTVADITVERMRRVAHQYTNLEFENDECGFDVFRVADQNPPPESS